MILHIETATPVCSVALAENSNLIALKESTLPNSHSTLLSAMIKEILDENHITYNQLKAIAVSKGPGSYTGLRIGVSTAKGLCYALNIPLISIPTLDAITEGAKQKYQGKNMLYCPMIDARRMEVYAALYNDTECIRSVQADIIETDTYQIYLDKSSVVFIGDGMAKCREILSTNANAMFDDTILASAAFMVPLAYEKFMTEKFEDVAYFEPFDLKEFVAGAPRVKGLRD